MFDPLEIAVTVAVAVVFLVTTRVLSRLFRSKSKQDLEEEQPDEEDGPAKTNGGGMGEEGDGKGEPPTGPKDAAILIPSRAWWQTPLVALALLLIVAILLTFHLWVARNVLLTIVAALLDIATLLNIIKLVPQRTVIGIEVARRYYDVYGAGPRLVIPFLMTIKKAIFVGEQRLTTVLANEPDPNDTSRPTRGDVETEDDSVGVFGEALIRVMHDENTQKEGPINVYRAIYAIDEYKTAIVTAVETAVRAKFGGLKVAEVVRTKGDVADEISKEYEKEFEKWGIKLIKYFIRDIKLSPETTTARRQMVTASAKAEATVSEADGDRRATIKRAEGDKEADILHGEGAGERIRRQADIGGIQPIEAAAIELQRDQYKTLADGTFFVSTGKGGSISIPAVVGQAKKVLDVLDGKDTTPPTK